jgi:glyoxylase-like metal-dependent hydrolase (beta-lactamase superfamily II)
MKHIDAETLRTWLDEHRPVTVVDVRNAASRAEWAIPGSLHVDASKALREGDAGPLADLPLDADRPLVTVCNRGHSSQKAAAVLERRGFDVWSLTGGMQAWSLAWNLAEVPLADSAARIVQVRRTGKGCLSYVAGSQGEAVVVDPSVEAGVYLDLAAREGWRIRHVIDTHVHADHLSRGRAIARLAGATLWLPETPRVRFPYEPLRDGHRVTAGGATLVAYRTPGHTDESTTLVLDGLAAFTGDTLFTTSVGRPDLKADATATRARARQLFASLTALAALPADMLILPGHTGEPIAFDGKPIAARLGDVTAWLSGWIASGDAFVERVVSHLPDTPPNYAQIVELNEAGEAPDVDPVELEAGANRCAIA